MTVTGPTLYRTLGTEQTADKLEHEVAARWTRDGIGRSVARIGLRSEASARFERGVDPAFLDDGLAILTGLIAADDGSWLERRTGDDPAELGRALAALAR